MDENETPENEDLSEFTKELREHQSIWERRHPFYAWLNEKFPKGYAHYSTHYIVTHPWEILRHWHTEIKYFFQRGFRGWDDSAIWSVDFYLSNLIIDIMKDYVKYSNGIPVSFFAEIGIQEETLENDVIGYSEKNMAIAEKEWKDRLNKIIEGFEAHLKLDRLSPYRDKEEYERLSKVYNDGFDLFKKYYDALWT